MRTRVVVCSAIGAATILLGLSVQASAQSTAPAPAANSYQYTYTDPQNPNWNNPNSWNNPNPNNWNNYSAAGTYSSGYGQYDQGATGWRGYAPAAYSGYGAGNYYGNAPYYGAYPGGPVQAGATYTGNVVTGAGGAMGASFGTPGYSGQAYAQQLGSERCAAKFRSYDPATGTFLGRDGRRHVCR